MTYFIVFLFGMLAGGLLTYIWYYMKIVMAYQKAISEIGYEVHRVEGAFKAIKKL